MNTIEQFEAWYENELLSVAAYARELAPGMTKKELVLVLSNEKIPDGAHLTHSQAEYFASRYEVLAPTHTTDSGLQVNVLLDRETGKTHFATAGTQFETDTINDLVIADGLIALGFAPKQQVIDAINYYLRVTTPENAQAPQVALEIVEVESYEEPIGGTRHVTEAMRVPTEPGLGLVAAGELAAVSGDHSSAGVISTGLARITGAPMAADVNAPGQTQAQQTLYQSIADALGTTLQPWPKVTHLDGSGLSFVSGHGGHEAGESIEIPLPLPGISGDAHSKNEMLDATERMLELSRQYPEKSVTEIQEMLRKEYETETINRIDWNHPGEDGRGWGGDPTSQVLEEGDRVEPVVAIVSNVSETLSQEIRDASQQIVSDGTGGDFLVSGTPFAPDESTERSPIPSGIQLRDLISQIPTDGTGGDFLGAEDFFTDRVETPPGDPPATAASTAGGAASQEVFLEIYGAGVSAFAEIMKWATDNNPVVAGKFTIIEVSADLIKIGIAHRGGDPYKIGEAAFEAMGSIIGGAIGGIAGAPFFPPAGSIVGTIIVSEIGEGIGKETWEALVHGIKEAAPVETVVAFAHDPLGSLTQEDVYGGNLPPSPTETIKNIEDGFGSWTAGYEPDTEDDTTWGGGLDDAPSRSEVYGEASTPAATTSLSDKLSKEIQDSANQLETDGTGRDFLGDTDFSTDDIEVSANPSTPIIPGDPIDRQPTIFSPDPNGLKPDITGTIDYTVSPIGTGGVITGNPIFGAATSAESTNPASTATPTRDPDADLNETNLEIGSGDTLSGIAQANGVSLDELLTANPQITHPDLIHSGQVINVPATTGDEGSRGGEGVAGGFGGVEQSSDNSIFTGESIQVAADGSSMRDISPGLLGETGQTGFGEHTPGGISTPPSDPVKGAFDSALSLVQAIQGGNEIGALASGAKIINDIAKANDVAGSDLPISDNTVSGLSSAASLVSALERGDEVGAAIEGARLANTLTAAASDSGQGFLSSSGLAGLGVVGGVYGMYSSWRQGDVAGVAVNAIQLTATVEAMAQAAGSTLGAIGSTAAGAAPFIGAIFSLAQGDYVGAAIQAAAAYMAAIYSIPYIGWIYAAYTILKGIFSKKDKGPPTGEGQITIGENGNLTAIATGKRGGDDIVRNALNDLITKAGNEGIALNPALLPSLKYNGSYYVLTYHNEGYQRAIASGDLVNLLLERARPLWTTLGVEGGTLYRQGNGSVVFMAEASAIKDLGLITGGGNVQGSPEVILVQKGDAVSSGNPNPGQIVPTARTLTESSSLFGGRTGDLAALALGFGTTGLASGSFVTANGLTGLGGGGGGGGGSGNVAYIHSADSLSSLAEPTPLSVARLGESALLSVASVSFGNAEGSDTTRPSAIATLLDSIPPTAPVLVPDAVRVLSVAQPPAPAEPVHDLTDMSALGTFSPVAASMDVSGTSDDTTGVLSIETAAPNSPPLATGEHFTGSEDTALQWTAAQLLANDTDPEGEALTLTAVGGASHGVVSLTAGVITFTPEANYFGEAGFDYTVTDAQGASASATVSLDLAPVNDAPLAGGEVLASDEDVIALIPASVLLANDTDVEGEALTINAVTNGRHGAVSLEADGSIRFIPDANFHGQAAFDYTVADTMGAESIATALINIAAVNDVPLAVGETLATVEDTETLIPQALLLANDTDADSATDGDVLSIVSVGAASHGTVSLAAGVVHFTPEINYFGSAGFDYTVSDGHGGEAVASASLEIAAVNDAPLALGETLAATEDTVALMAPALLLANDTDVEGETLAIGAVGTSQHGSVSLDADGTVRFTPAADFHGAASFDYTVLDTSGGQSLATATLTVAAVNDVPVAVGERMALDEDTTAVIAASLLLANDSDADTATDGDSLSINSVTGAQHGSVSLLADGTVQFVPEANFSGTAAFDYSVRDTLGASASATSYLDIAPVNDAPLVTDDFFVTDHDTVNFIAPATLLANDTDVESDPLTLTGVGNPSHGSVEVEADGSIRFTPEAAYIGEATFDYTVSDGSDSASARVYLEVQENRAPIAVPETIAGSEDALLLIDPAALLANDTDPNGDALSITQVGNPVYGSVALGAGGVIQFQPQADFYGAASFDYTISDGRGGVAATTATLAIQSVNDNPTVSAESVTVYEDATADIAASLLLANDTDVDGDGLSISAVWGAGNGWVSLSGGTVYYTPSPDFSGADQFSYRVSDGRGGAADTTAYLDVRNLNDPPDVYVPGGGVYFTGVSGSLYTGLIASEDPDGPNDRQTHTIAYAPAVGSASVDYQGTLVDWSYNSGGSGDGSIAFTVRISDDDGAYLDVDIFPIGQWWRVGGYGGYLGVTPVVLDLDGDGVELIALADSAARFDVDGDGVREAIAWVAADDALLAYDPDRDGDIARIDEISFAGYLPGARTDLEGLAAFDTNHDRLLSASDTEWERFGVWQDTNQDGRTDPGEFRTLAQEDIAQIALESDHRLETREGNVIFGTAAYTKADGTDAELADVRLAYEETPASGSDPAQDHPANDNGGGAVASAPAPVVDPQTSGASPVRADSGTDNAAPLAEGAPIAAESPSASAPGATPDPAAPTPIAAAGAESASPTATDPAPVRAAADPLLVQAEIDRLVTQLCSDMAAFDPRPPAEISLPIPPEPFDSMLASDTYRDQTYLQGVG